MALIDTIKTGDIKEIKKLFARPAFGYDQAKAINEFKVDKHAVFDTSVRKPKTIKKGTGEVDSKNEEITTTETVEVARIGLSFQELIVDRRVGFMLTIPVDIDPIFAGDKSTDKEKALIALVKRIQNDNKMDYKNKEIARRMMSEMEVAEAWYLVESGMAKPKFTLKCNIWSPDLGDTLYPLFDQYGDMMAFAREYKLREGEKDIEHFDVYLSEAEYKFVNRDNNWTLDDQLFNAAGQKVPNPKPNEVGKIMIVYHSQKKPEWANQGSAISRLETSYSNHADMNDYFGSPILAVIGQILGFSSKGEQGKILEIEGPAQDAWAKFLELSAKPESLEMEQNNLKEAIYALSQTPDISFGSLLKIGPVSGIALKMMFLDAHLAVGKKEETFGIGLQRRLNIIKAAIGKVIDTSLSSESESIQIIPKITPYIPLNETELIDNLSISISSGQMSKETGAELNPLVPDPKTEILKLKNEATNEIAGL